MGILRIGRQLGAAAAVRLDAVDTAVLGLAHPIARVSDVDDPAAVRGSFSVAVE
jgi:hypothetical protein